MWMGSVNGASGYEFVELSSIDLCVKPFGLAGITKAHFSGEYPYHIPTKKSSVFYK